MKIIVKRDSGWSDSIRDYQIMLDGVLAAKISDGQTIELDAPVGRHTLQARIDWSRTELIEFTLGDAPATFEVFSKVRGLKVLLTIVFVIIPGMWIGIRRTDTPIRRLFEVSPT
jgi:hypothetical protein